MELNIYYQKHLSVRNKDLTLHGSNVCVLNKADNGQSIRYLMRQALMQGCSVLVYSSFPDYYKYISDIAPNMLSGITHEDLLESAGIPYIKGTNEQTLKDIESCFSDYMMEKKFRYLSSRRDGKRYFDPNMHQCFYQIKAGNTTKRKVITESFLVNVISQALHSRPIHEVVLFLDMPFRPITDTTLEMLKKIEDTSNVRLICLYSGSEYDKQPYAFNTDGEKVSILASNKEFKVLNEEIYQK